MGSTEADFQPTTAALYDSIAGQPTTIRRRYWDSPRLSQLVQQRFSDATGCATMQDFISRYTNRTHFGTGISIACGAAEEEIWLLKLGFVDHFILCDFSSVQLALAREHADRIGVDANRITFLSALDMTKPFSEKIDLVYWRMALHHMLDTDAAVAWSIASLRGDGAMYCNDYCGPNRMQWPAEMLAWAERYRKALPDAYMLNPEDPSTQFPLRAEPHSVQFWVNRDPTECPDSENIIPALKKHAPDSRIFYLGGVIYHLALNDIIHNFDDERDAHLLQMAMMIDGVLADSGLTHYFTSVTDVRNVTMPPKESG